MDIKKEREQIHILETLLLKDKEEAAINLIEKIEAEFPDSFQIKFIKAKSFIKLKMYIKAEEILKEIEKGHSDNQNLLRVMSDFYEKVDRKDESLDYLNKLNFMDPFNVEIKDKIKDIKIQIERKKKATADTLPEAKLQDLMAKEKSGEQLESEFKVAKEEEDLPEFKVESDAELIPEVKSESELDIPEITEDKKEVIPEIEVEIEEKTIPDIKDEEDEFNTISAAELYINQGLYKDALVILENIYMKENSEEIFIKIQNLKNRIKTEQKIEQLTSFMDMIKKAGS